MQHTINVKGKLIDLSQPQVMGILNVTPDSFFDGCRQQTESAIADRANQIINEGATMIDVGACSTRPGSTPVSEEEEKERLRMALRIIRREQPQAILSVDTFRPEVARLAVEEWGADIINDVSEAQLPGMAETVARLHVPYIYTSVRGPVADVIQGFVSGVQRLRSMGVSDIVLDPGFGFGKTLEQNYDLMHQLHQLQTLDLPILVGISRKSMIFKLLNGTPATSLNGTTVLHTVALQKGASILRVHDVREAVECVKIVQALHL